MSLLDSLRDAVAAFDVKLDQLDEKKDASGALHGRGRILFPVHGLDLGKLEGVHVELPVDVTITLDEKGRVRAVDHDLPAMDEIMTSVRQIASTGARTHAVEVDDKGRRVLRRKRFGY